MPPSMDKFTLISKVPLIRKANSLLFKYRRNLWPVGRTIELPKALMRQRRGRYET